MTTNKRTISIEVINHAGVLTRVAGLFSRRGFNIDSIAVGRTEDLRSQNDYWWKQIRPQVSN